MSKIYTMTTYYQSMNPPMTLHYGLILRQSDSEMKSYFQKFGFQNYTNNLSYFLKSRLHFFTIKTHLTDVDTYFYKVTTGYL